MSEKRKKRSLETVTGFMEEHRGRKKVHRRNLASLTGELMFISRAVTAGRTFCSRLYRCQVRWTRR